MPLMVMRRRDGTTPLHDDDDDDDDDDGPYHGQKETIVIRSIVGSIVVAAEDGWDSIGYGKSKESSPHHRDQS